MAPNLLALLEQQFSNEVVGRVASAIGEDEDATRRAITWALPAILGRLVTLASSPQGVGGLFTLLHESRLDGWRLGQAAAALASEPTANHLRTIGPAVVTRLFGTHRQALTESTASFGRIGSRSSATLLALLVPLVMDLVAKETTEFGGFNPRALSRLLSAQAHLLERSDRDAPPERRSSTLQRLLHRLSWLWPIPLLLAFYWSLWP